MAKALNNDLGPEVHCTLATVVIGGVLSSTLLTLVVLTVLCGWVKQNAKAEFASLPIVALETLH